LNRRTDPVLHLLAESRPTVSLGPVRVESLPYDRPAPAVCGGTKRTCTLRKLLTTPAYLFRN